MQNITSIIVGIDFTPCSAVALRQAMRVASISRATLRPIHVIDTLVVVDMAEALSEMQTNIREALIGDAQQAWSTFAAEIPGAADVRLEVEVNNRIVGILRLAKRAKADLLVMGAFGTRKPEVGVGTVASACVRKSMTDVLLVRDTQGGPYRKLVAAVDFSETSHRALERAAMLAAQDGADVHVLHVFDAPWKRLYYRAPTAHATPHFKKQYSDALQRRLTSFSEAVCAEHARVGFTHVVHDASGHRSGITQYAESVGADLIVLGTRGRTNLRDVLLGSTAEKVLQESRCSILAVKPKGFRHRLASDDEPGVLVPDPST